MPIKSEVFQIRLTEEEKALIQRQAAEMGLPMGRYLVMLALKAAKQNTLENANNQ